MASHRQKRAFQPSITSFFGRIDRDEYEQARNAQAAQHPVLEDSVQSDLLSVGMRIRKAVPEGYKTHKTSLFYDPTPALATNPTSNTYTPMRLNRPIELQPFCGLHKVGGLSVQDMSRPVDSHEPFDIFNDDRMPFTSSQESNASTLSTDSMPAAPILNPMLKNKRRYLEDEENDGDIPPFQLQFSDPLDPLLAGLSMTSPIRSNPLGHMHMPNLNAISSRPIARPKTRRKGSSNAMATFDASADGMEFEEADFLVPQEDEMEL